LRAQRKNRFKIYLKYEGRKGPPSFLKVRLPQHGGFEDGPSLGIKKMFVDQYNRVREFLSYYSCHLRSELGIAIPDEDAISAYIGYGGMLLVCDGSAPGKPKEPTIVAWGKHTFSDSSGDAPAPVLSLQRKRILNVACGTQHTLTLTEGGRVFGWGQNDFGQLGTGDEDARPLPTLAAVPYEAFIADIAAGNEFGMARTKKGELWTWGRMQASNWPRLFADSWCNGYESKGEKGIKGLKVEQMSAGEMHCAVIASGKLFTWGYNDYGQLGWGLHGKDRTGQQKPHEVALEGQTPARVACGGAHTLCVTAEGKVFGWGSNVMGQLNHGLRDVFPQPMEIAVSEPMAEVFAGRCSSVAIAKSRFAQIWGRMQAEDPTAPTEGDAGKDAKAGGDEAAPAPPATGAGGYPSAPASAASALSRFADQQAHVDGEAVYAALGEAHGVLAMADGAVIGWGYNSVQQAAGKVTSESFLPPTPVTMDGRALRVSCGGAQSIALIIA